VRSAFPPSILQLLQSESLEQHFSHLFARLSPLHEAVEVLTRHSVWQSSHFQPQVEVGSQGRVYSTFTSGVVYEETCSLLDKGAKVAPFVLFSDGMTLINNNMTSKMPNFFWCFCFSILITATLVMRFGTKKVRNFFIFCVCMTSDFQFFALRTFRSIQFTLHPQLCPLNSLIQIALVSWVSCQNVRFHNYLAHFSWSDEFITHSSQNLKILEYTRKRGIHCMEAIATHSIILLHRGEHSATLRRRWSV
jgi:hypothetical protein